jgi:hypothetical protein
MSGLICPNEKCINPYKITAINYNPQNNLHFLLLQDYFSNKDPTSVPSFQLKLSLQVFVLVGLTC